MKYLFVIICILFNNFFALSQIRQNFLFTDVKNAGQLGPNTCWASTFEILSNIYKPTQRNIQCGLLDTFKDESYSDDSSCCGLKCSFAQDASPIPFTQLLDIFKSDFSNFSITASFKQNSFSFNSLKRDYSTKSIFQKEYLSWNSLKANFDTNRSPICFWKYYTYASGHITSIIGYEHSKDLLLKNQLRWLFIQDPWPQGYGSKYVMTFEFYKKIVPDGDESEPFKALIYNFNKKDNSKPINFVFENTINSNKTFCKNIITDIKKNKFVTSLEEIGKTISHLNNNSSDSLLNFIGLKRNNFFIDSTSIIDIYYLSGEINENKAARTLPDGNNVNQSEIKNWFFNGYLTLLSDVSELLVTVKDNNGNNKAVFALDTTLNNQWYVSRIEPYRTTIMPIINDLIKRGNFNIKELNKIYFHRAKDSYPDFLIIEPKKNSDKQPVFIDLFSQVNNLGLSSNQSNRTGIFNYTKNNIEGDNFKKIISYLPPIIKVSEGGKQIIQAFQKLVLFADSTCAHTNSLPTAFNPIDSNVCRNSKVSAQYLFSWENKSGLVPFIATYYNYPNGDNDLAHKYFFIQCQREQDYESSRADVSSDCKTCYPKKPIYYPYSSVPGNMQVLFVTVSNYHTLEKFDYTINLNNWNKLKAIALQTNTIKQIGNPRLESFNGYLNTDISEKQFSNNYTSKMSAKGIICDVLLKEGKVVQCYVFCNQDSNVPNGLFQWKE